MAEAREGRNKFARRGGLVVTLLLALVIGVLYVAWGRRAAVPPVDAAPSAEAASTTQERIDFAAGSARLPADAVELLVRIADATRLVPGGRIEIVAWRPAGADSLMARERAEAARHALEANGVMPARMRVVMAEAPAGTGAVEAERVELQVR